MVISNVLNKRGNVSVEKIEAVYQAAKQMGYQLNTQAQLLRTNRSHKIRDLITPNWFLKICDLL